jgi:hypothetical protein
MQPMKPGVVPRVIMHDPANDLRQQRVRVVGCRRAAKVQLQPGTVPQRRLTQTPIQERKFEMRLYSSKILYEASAWGGVGGAQSIFRVRQVSALGQWHRRRNLSSSLSLSITKIYIYK